MTRKTSYLFSLFESLCETLSECARVESRAKPGSYAYRKSIQIKAATEPLAISCLDEEFCDMPAAVVATYTSCSIPLIEHMQSLTRRSVHMSFTDWSTILLSTTAQTVEDMFDRGLLPYNGLLPMMHEIRSGKTDWTPLLLNRVASKAALEEKDLEAIVRFRFEGKSKDSLTTIASALRIQAASFQTILSDVVAKSLKNHDSINMATACILAGLPVEEITSKSRPDNKLCDAFLAKLSSHHGILALHHRFGSLENFLADHSLRHKFFDDLSDDFKARDFTPAQ